jgi:hypothetical protein
MLQADMDVSDHATRKIPGEGFKRPCPPRIKMDESVKAKVERLFGKGIA